MKLRYILIVGVVLGITTNLFAGTKVKLKVADSVQITGLIQTRFETSFTDGVDYAGKVEANPVNSNFRMRRARIRFDFYFDKNFKGVVRFTGLNTSSIASALEYGYLEYKYRRWLKARAGQFKAPFSMEELQGSNALWVIDRGPTNKLFVTNNWAGLQQGFMLGGGVKSTNKAWGLKYLVGVFAGNGPNTTADNNSQKNYGARVEGSYKAGNAEYRIGINSQIGTLVDVTGSASGLDFLYKRKLNSNFSLLLGTETLTGHDLSSLSDDSTTNNKSDYIMFGSYAFAKVQYRIGGKCLDNIEIGAKYELVDQNVDDVNDDYVVLTPHLALNFDKKGNKTVRFNVLRTSYAQETASKKANLIGVIQAQLKF